MTDEERLGLEDLAHHVEEEVIPHATRTAQRVGNERNRRWRWFWIAVVLLAISGVGAAIGFQIPHNDKIIHDKNVANGGLSSANSTISAQAPIIQGGQALATSIAQQCKTAAGRAAMVKLGISCEQAAIIVTATPAVVAGPAGPGGPVGPQGPQGIPGAPGAQGLPGTRGAAGPEGPQGSTGPNGQTVTGPAGENGGQGAQGPAGDTVTGPAGPQGEQGPAGQNGVDGTNGTDGKDGADGASAPTITGVSEDQAACTITLTLSDGSTVSGPIHGTLMCP